jgi:peptidoglycan-associated lipoprotein
MRTALPSFLLPLTVTMFMSAVGVGCASSQSAQKDVRRTADASATAPAKAVENAEVGGAVSADPNAPDAPVFFAFDSDELSPAGKETLQQMATYLAAKPAAAITVEGHCDDAGTPEYNLALGARRAEAIVKYLTNLGVNKDRLRAVSYGEERPMVAGSHPSAQAQNRRGELVSANQRP